MALRGIRRILSKISIRLLAFNALLVFIPAMAVSYLEVYERKLLWAQERSMVQQGRALAAALSEQGPLSPSSSQSILARLEQQTTSRVRVLDHEGRLLADTSRLGSVAAASASSGPYEGVARDPRGSHLYRLGAALFRFWEWVSGAPGAPVSQEYYVANELFQGGEIQQALRGRYGAATRITPGGQRSVTLYSALPVWDGGQVVGVVLVSQSTFRILQDLYEIRLFAFRFVLGAVAVAAFLTLLLSTTISYPLNRLRSQAVALVDRRGRLTAKFRATKRLDEIGDLSRALSELSEHLEERMRFVESLAADVAHEFRNPLTSIRAAAEMLAEVDDPADRARFARIIQTDIARLERLLADVREVTQVDAPLELESENEPVVLNELLKALVGSQNYIRDGIRIHLDLPDREVVVSANADRLVRVFENLLDNAMGFSPEKGTIRVRLDSQGAWGTVSVIDEGPGIQPEHHGRVFDRFFSYRPGDAHAKEHSGLGLAIVKAILEREGGLVSVSPASTGGACFTVQLRTEAASKRWS